MPRRLIAATARAAGMSVILLGCGGGPAKSGTGSAPASRPDHALATGSAGLRRPGAASFRTQPCC